MSVDRLYEPFCRSWVCDKVKCRMCASRVWMIAITTTITTTSTSRQHAQVEDDARCFTCWSSTKFVFETIAFLWFAKLPKRTRTSLLIEGNAWSSWWRWGFLTTRKYPYLEQVWQDVLGRSLVYISAAQLDLLTCLRPKILLLALRQQLPFWNFHVCVRLNMLIKCTTRGWKVGFLLDHNDTAIGIMRTILRDTTNNCASPSK